MEEDEGGGDAEGEGDPRYMVDFTKKIWEEVHVCACTCIVHVCTIYLYMYTVCVTLAFLVACSLRQLLLYTYVYMSVTHYNADLQ